MSYIQSDDYHSAPSVRLFQCTRKETTSKLSVFLSSSEKGARTTEEGDGANTPKPLSRKKDKLVIILTGNIQCLVERCKILRKKLSEFHPKIKKHCAFMAGSLLRNIFLTLQNIKLLSCIISFTSWCCVQVKNAGKMLMSHYFTNQRWQQYSWIIVTTGVNDKVCWPSQHNTLHHQPWRGRVKRGRES